MLRSIDFLMVGALIAGAAWTFKVKHDAQGEAAHLARLETRIRLEKEAIDILKADWSLLTSPDRLERLVARYKDQLGLEPLNPRQIVTLDDIPLRQEALPPIDGETVDAPGPDRKTMTGSVRPAAANAVTANPAVARSEPVGQAVTGPKRLPAVALAPQQQASGWTALRETTAERAARERREQ